MMRNKQFIWIRLSLVIFLSILIAISACSRGGEDWLDIRARLEPAIGEMSKLPSQTELTESPTIEGKIVVIETAGIGYFLNDIYYEALKDIFATSTDEINTVALVSCTRKQDGVYKSQNGPAKEVAAFRSSCDLFLVNRAKNAVIFKRTFSAVPSETARRSGDFVFGGAETQFEIRNFLKQLPHK